MNDTENNNTTQEQEVTFVAESEMAQPLEICLEVLGESGNDRVPTHENAETDPDNDDESEEDGCCQEDPDQEETETEQVTEEVGQLSLFGALEGVTTKPAPKPADNKKAPADASTAKPQAKVPDKPIGQPVVCCYAGQKISITETTLTLDQIRAKLQRDFPELTKDNTDIQYDEKTALVRIYPLGKKRG